MLAATSLPTERGTLGLGAKVGRRRALIRATDGRITVLTRSGADVITSFPEQEALAAVIG